MLKKWSKRLKKDERGLTLVELLAVVVILAIVAAIAFILIGNVIENSRKDAHISNAQQLIAAAKLYESNGGTIHATSGVSSETLENEGVLGPLTSPWKDTGKSYTGTVYVQTTENKKTYRVEFPHSNCNINATESALNSEDRDTICSSGSDPDGESGSGG